MCRWPQVGVISARRFVDVRVELLDRLPDRGRRVGSVRRRGAAGEHQAQGGEALERLVVQLACPAPALCLGRREASGAGARSAADCAVATAVAALVANASSSRCVLGGELGPPSSRSIATSAP